MKKKKFGLENQGYVAPRAESVGMSNQGLLCASPIDLEGDVEEFGLESTNGTWDEFQP